MSGLWHPLALCDPVDLGAFSKQNPNLFDFAVSFYCFSHTGTGTSARDRQLGKNMVDSRC